MKYERVVGLEVIDDIQYSLYRENMKPILSQYDGGFGYDFKISEVLKSEVESSINRVFTIYFPSEQASNNFFKDPQYLRVKEKFFAESVNSTTTIAQYLKPE